MTSEVCFICQMTWIRAFKYFSSLKNRWQHHHQQEGRAEVLVAGEHHTDSTQNWSRMMCDENRFSFPLYKEPENDFRPEK